MKSERLKVFEKSVIWITIISALIISALYLILQKNNYEEYSDKITQYLKEREYELAENIIENKNLKSIQNTFKVLQSFNTGAYQVTSSNGILFSWALTEDSKVRDSMLMQEAATSILKSCKNKVKYALTLGVLVGHVESCLSPKLIAKSTFTADSFLATLFLTLISLALLAAFILSGYRKSLEASVDKTILALKKWNTETKEDGSPNELVTDDKLTNKILTLVKEGHESRQELIKVSATLETEKEVSRVIRQVAHDIKDPIHSLARVVKIASENIDDNLKKVIDYSLKRVDETFSDVLKFRKQKEAEALQQTVKPKTREIDISPMLNEFFESMRLNHRHIQFNLNTPSEAKVLCNEQELRRVLSNIINNSIDAFEDSSTGKYISCEVSKKANCTEVQISDNGIGIKSEYQKHVFKEHFTKEKINGNGLGLYYVAKKIKEWNGKIALKSKYKMGTVLNIELLNKGVGA